MNNSKAFERYLLLYLPWVLACFLEGSPVLSYFTAWLGSFYIFFIVYSGWIKPMPNDRTMAEQLMRPVYLVQIIFIGYMACSSVFYFFSLLGVGNLAETAQYGVSKDMLALAAQCQRYYVLGHAAFATGMVLCMRYPIKHKYHVQNSKLAGLLLTSAVILIILSSLANNINGLLQFSFQFRALSFIAGTLALAFAIPLKKVLNTTFSLILYFINFYAALTSGFKEPIIISVLVLGIFLYPSYKKLVTIIFIPALLALFLLLPTYMSIYRANAWGEDVDADDAYKIALDATVNSDDSKDDTNWAFLVYRLSEIDMFTRYIQSTPSDVDYYDWKLVEQAGIAIVPRFFWPTKPSTEDLVMERVYAAGVVNRNSTVSAKPAYIVDGYLSGGALGVFLALFVYGAAAQLISQRAEFLFGGYVLGTALIYSGLFQIMWRGLSFEFLLNSVFWSYITMMIMHKLLKAYNILEEI